MAGMSARLPPGLQPLVRTGRHSDMRGLAPLAVAVFVALLGVASCSSSSPPLRQDGASVGAVAEVTGFRSATGMMGSASSGPVTVRVTGAQASRLALLADRLPSTGYVHCAEPPGLIYRISFSAGSVARSTAVVDGYDCGTWLTVTVAGKIISRRLDAGCELLGAVRAALPARAKLTQDIVLDCGQ